MKTPSTPEQIKERFKIGAIGFAAGSIATLVICTLLKDKSDRKYQAKIIKLQGWQ